MMEIILFIVISNAVISAASLLLAYNLQINISRGLRHKAVCELEEKNTELLSQFNAIIYRARESAIKNMEYMDKARSLSHGDK